MGTSISDNMNNINMMVAKKDDFWESLSKAGALIGGAWIAVEIMKALAKKVYRCPDCHNIVQENESPCHSCGATLLWNL